MSFEQDMKRFEQKVAGASEATIRAAGLQVFTAIIERTPVDTGRARGNWRTAVGHRPVGTLDEQDKSGRQAIAGASLAAASFTLADTLYFANNLPYIERLESGSSQQAPAGMVEVTVNGFRQAVEAGARKHRI